MMYASATVDIGDVKEGLDAMERRVRALHPAFQQVKAAMKVDQKEHREQQEGPDGKWAPRARSTSHDGHRKLPRKLLGKLPTAVSYRASAIGAFGESRVKWSQVHQDGGVVGRGAKLPERTFLWISDKLLAAAENIIGDVVLRAFGGG